MATDQFNVWEGIYDSFDEAPGKGLGFTSTRWIETQRQRLEQRLKEPVKPTNIPPSPWYPGSLLPIVIAMLVRKTSRLVVLDVGGGGGLTWLDVSSGVPDTRHVEYHIVDLEPVCRMAETLFKDDGRVRFHTQIPGDLRPDVVHFGSSLQYMEDWKGLLAKTCSMAPRMMVFADLMAGDVPTFASLQNDYGSKTPTWFFNLQEFLGHLDSLGYRPVYRAAYLGKILDKMQPPPQGNFPAEYRIGHSCHVVLQSVDDER